MTFATRFRKRYEPVHPVQVDTLSEQSHAASDHVKPTTKLPARALPGRRNAYYIFGVAIIVTVITLTAFSLVLRSILGWLPNYDPPLVLGTSSSCDLVSGNNSKIEQAFIINLRSPMHFSFATAKGIDVLWDLCIGQGGRLLLAWISYMVFMDGLTRLLETSAISYQLYATMVFDTTSLRSTWSSLKAISTGHGWCGRAFLAWFVAASIYVLAFPTLISAATGYVSPSTAGIRLPDQTFVSATSGAISNCCALLDPKLNSLVGLNNNEKLVTGPSIQELNNSYMDAEHKASLNSSNPSFMTMYDYYQNRNRRTFGGPLDGINVPGYIPDSDVGEEYQFTTNITLNGKFYKFNNYDPAKHWSMSYCYKDVWIPVEYSSMAYCLPESYFVWGFSSLLLYIIGSLQIVWTLGMFIVWLDASINSQLCCNGRTIRGSLRASLDIAEAIREVLGEESCAYQNAEISRALEKMRVGVQYYATDVDGYGVSHIGLSSTRSGQLSLRNGKFYGGSGASRESSCK